MNDQWYLQHKGRKYGPVPTALLKQLAVVGKVQPQDKVKVYEKNGKHDWVPASSVLGLFPSSQGPTATSGKSSAGVSERVLRGQSRFEAWWQTRSADQKNRWIGVTIVAFILFLGGGIGWSAWPKNQVLGASAMAPKAGEKQTRTRAKRPEGATDRAAGMENGAIEGKGNGKFKTTRQVDLRKLILSVAGQEEEKPKAGETSKPDIFNPVCSLSSYRATIGWPDATRNSGKHGPAGPIFLWVYQCQDGALTLEVMVTKKTVVFAGIQ